MGPFKKSAARKRNLRTCPGTSISLCTSVCRRTSNTHHSCSRSDRSGKSFLWRGLPAFCCILSFLCWANLTLCSQGKSHRAPAGLMPPQPWRFLASGPVRCLLTGSQEHLLARLCCFQPLSCKNFCGNVRESPEPFHRAGVWAGLSSKDLSGCAVNPDLWFNPA